MIDMNEIIQRLAQAWPCCTLASVRVACLLEREKDFFVDFMPEAITAIVLLHHVTTEEEWTWYVTGDGEERCDADDHLRDLALTIKDALEQEGHDAKLVKYPGVSGLQFRFVAEAAGLGSIGTNAFLFHPAWGPWVHLRVMGTTAEVDLRPKLSGDQFCDECGLCISECPAQAISDTSFQGLQCRSYRKARGEYDPRGPDGLLPWCKRCIWICPKGKQPVPRADNERTVEPSVTRRCGKPRA
jgi:epoxyqueuosine reductase QueG